MEGIIEKVSSYERINYSIRPSKAIERKMLCESFRKLDEFAALETYRYIGFGSTFFSDFILFHKNLGITNMISIEKDIENQERFEFNKPFNCIEMQFGLSQEILPTLQWDYKSIIWLDYDTQINEDVLTDVNTIFSNIISGSVVVFTCNAHYRPNQAYHVIKKSLNNIPHYIKEDDCENWKAALVTRRIILDKIIETINTRNFPRRNGNKFVFQQLFNFHYSDGARMMTFGGIFYEEGEKERFEKCGFFRLPYIKIEESPFYIEVPSLTIREIRNLDAQLPNEDLANVVLPGVKHEDIRKYSENYRFFPTFSETDL
ncbi:O-methyltransferase [Paenibacillus cymbidii]|uniref:O-methyltransferase n=1 Tax=Paenibacillus cymbidii TaxID=1639034 RepID=UPI001080AFDD|nr:O-methyltransferase [Paenibacillus cymbidii]